MIVNSRKTSYVIVELTKHDIELLIKGQDVVTETRAYSDDGCLVRVYCSEVPDACEREELE